LIYLPRLVKEEPPDLILLDLSMPALSGVKVAMFIRRYEKHPIPIVLYSSRPIEELRETMLEMDAAGFVQKGEPDKRFLAAVSTALRAQALTSR
jgi:DNA-binding NarL/FixJ family response regulator